MIRRRRLRSGRSSAAYDSISSAVGLRPVRHAFRTLGLIGWLAGPLFAGLLVAPIVPLVSRLDEGLLLCERALAEQPGGARQRPSAYSGSMPALGLSSAAQAVWFHQRTPVGLNLVC